MGGTRKVTIEVKRTKVKGAPPRKNHRGNRGRSKNGAHHYAPNVNYWGSNKLEKHKVRNIRRDYAKSGRILTYNEAAKIWHASRKVA